jgi:hypothetical protein
MKSTFILLDIKGRLTYNSSVSLRLNNRYCLRRFFFEKDIPTQKPETQKGSWFPEQDEKQRRPRSNSAETFKGESKIDCIRPRNVALYFVFGV